MSLHTCKKGRKSQAPRGHGRNCFVNSSRLPLPQSPKKAKHTASYTLHLAYRYPQVRYEIWVAATMGVTLKIFTQRHKDRKGRKAFVRCLFFNLQKSRKNLRFLGNKEDIKQKLCDLCVPLCLCEKKSKFMRLTWGMDAIAL